MTKIMLKEEQKQLKKDLTGFLTEHDLEMTREESDTIEQSIKIINEFITGGE